jgi:hypothetical protein
MKHFLHTNDPTSNPDDASENSSFITISEPDDHSTPSSPTKNLLNRFSPYSKALFNKLFKKRSLDTDPSDDFPEPPAKKQHRDTDLEAKIIPGSITTVGFHQFHYDLDKFQCYLPLSLFTNENLRIILREANTLPP